VLRAMIADGTLKPGDRAPGGAALHRKTGVALTYCLYALRALEDDGTLVPRSSVQGKLRIVAGPAQRSGGQADTPGAMSVTASCLACPTSVSARTSASPPIERGG
jgi:DNA-binding FadR family transcriptional regulator